MERPVVEKDPREVGEPHLGLKVLYNPLNAGASIDCDIIAVHGIGAHPDLTWCKKVEQGSNKEGADVNWLEDANMLPAALPNARIMRFGAKTKWFGNRSIQQTASDVARHLLGAIRRDRDTNENDSKTRPLIFVAHCFGGLVVMKALNEAVDSDLNRHIFNSVTGIAFMGTPFRGAEQTGQTALVLGAREVYRDVHPGILEITAPHSEMRRNILREFTRKQKDLDAYIVCFYELEYCDVMVVLGEEKDPEMPETIRVDENSGSLDSADEKIGLQRHHYNMNKFGGPGEETYKIVQEQVVNMATRSKTKARYDDRITQRGTTRDKDRYLWWVVATPIPPGANPAIPEISERHLLWDTGTPIFTKPYPQWHRQLPRDMPFFRRDRSASSEPPWASPASPSNLSGHEYHKNNHHPNTRHRPPKKRAVATGPQARPSPQAQWRTSSPTAGTKGGTSIARKNTQSGHVTPRPFGLQSQNVNVDSDGDKRKDQPKKDKKYGLKRGNKRPRTTSDHEG